MRTWKRFLGGSKKKTVKPRRRTLLSVEALEDRTLPAVTSLLSGGILDIALDASEAAKISVLGPNIQVSAGGATSSFAASSVQSINAHSTGGSHQSLTLTGTVTLAGGLDVAGLEDVTLTGAVYQASEVTIAYNAGFLGNHYAPYSGTPRWTSSYKSRKGILIAAYAIDLTTGTVGLDIANPGFPLFVRPYR